MNSLMIDLEPLMPRLGSTLMHSLWEGALISVLLATSFRLTRHRSASLRYVIACGAMLLFVLIVAATFASLSPALPQHLMLADLRFSQTTSTLTPALKPTNSAPHNISTEHSAPNYISREYLSSAHVTPTQSHRSSVIPAQPMRLIGFAWLIGTIAVAVWHLTAWAWVQWRVCGRRSREIAQPPALGRLRDSIGVTRHVRLLECAHLDVPAVVGVLWPAILIPLGFFTDLAPQQVEAILLHELAHIHRHDYFINLLQVVAESLLFYHPTTWWISSQIRREREHCCDDVVAGRYATRSYVAALLALEQRRTRMASAVIVSLSTPAIAATGGTLLERVQRLLGQSPSAPRRPMRSFLAAALMLACIALPIVMQGCGKSDSSPATAHSTATTDPAVVDAKSEGITAADLQPDYSVDCIGVGDALDVIISDLTGPGVQTIRHVTVSAPDGAIAMPLITTGIPLAGKTELDAQKAVAKAYRDAKIIVDATVSVSRTDPRSTAYTVLGNALKSGQFNIPTADTRLTSALANSAARLDGHGIILITRRTTELATRTLKISERDLMAGDSACNVYLRPGDVIMLPAAIGTQSIVSSGGQSGPTPLTDALPSAAGGVGDFYVGGNSGSPGIYAIPPDNITLKQAIISAHATEPGFVSVTRRDGDRETLILQNASLHDLNVGALPDMMVHPGDTITLSLDAVKWQGATTQQTLMP